MIINKFNKYWEYNYPYFGLATSLLTIVNFYFELIPRIYVLSIVSLYLIIDNINCFYKKDYQYILHHFSGLSIILYSVYINIHNSHHSDIFIKMENSNIFLNLIMLTRGNLKIFFAFIFYFAFMYFRIFNFYYVLFQDDTINFYSYIYKSYKLNSLLFLFIPCLNVILLNIYWSILLTKKMARKISKIFYEK